MKIGHLDGKGIVYDSEGTVILDKDERLTGRFENVFLDITGAWRTWCVRNVFPGEPGRTVCYVTDRRIVFVRRPDVYKAGAYLMTPLGAPQGAADMYKASMILRAGGFEYCELTPGDLWFYRRVRTGVVLLLMDKGRKYAAFVMTKTVTPASFSEVLKSWLEAKGVTLR